MSQTVTTKPQEKKAAIRPTDSALKQRATAADRPGVQAGVPLFLGGGLIQRQVKDEEEEKELFMVNDAGLVQRQATDEVDDEKEEDGALFLQAKLIVNEPGDPYEREADRVADRVMRQATAPGPISTINGTNGRKGGTGKLIPSSPGQPLDTTSRSYFEENFKEDFAQVRVHTDPEAVQAARALHAQAFTQGHDVYFDRNFYRPHTPQGRRLLAHELTHVVQQRGLEATATRSKAIQRQVSDPIPEVANQFYAHGAFMGAAREMLADPKWNRILEVLMPDVHSDVTAALARGRGSDEIILMLENNPVMAAYGLVKTQEMDQRREGGRSDRIERMVAMEWDAWLPTRIVQEYKDADNTADQDRLARQMVDEMLIAHGTRSQTLKENVFGRRQYANVRQTRKSGQGGVLPGAWMDLFGRALQLAIDPDWEQQADEYTDPSLHPRINSPNDQARHLTFQNQLTFRQVIDLYKGLFNKETFSVLLDIKSRDASPRVLRAVVRELNRRGVHVYGVGSFEHQEILGLGRMRQEVDGRIYTGPRQVKFYHLAGDLQNDCLSGEVFDGDTVMFNAASLVSYDRFARGPQKKASYQINEEVVRQLRIYKQHYGFHLGVYVQEHDIDDRAATLITELTNDNPDVFDLGFAWGGLSGLTATDIEPSLFHATVGFGGQSVPGTFWDTSKPLPSSGTGAATPAPTGVGGGSAVPATGGGAPLTPTAPSPPASVPSTSTEVVVPPVTVFEPREETLDLFDPPPYRVPFTQTIIELPPPLFFATAGIYGNVDFKLELFLRYGPAVLRDIRLALDATGGRYSGTAQLYLPVAAGPRAILRGSLLGSVELWGLRELEIIALEGGLQAIGQAPIILALAPSVRLLYDAGSLSFAFRGQVEAGAALTFDLNAFAEARLLGEKVWEEVWQLYHWHWGRAIRMGSIFSFDYDNGQLGPVRQEPFAEDVPIEELLQGMREPAQQGGIQVVSPDRQPLDTRLPQLLGSAGADPHLILATLAEATEAEKTAVLADPATMGAIQAAVGPSLWPIAQRILNNGPSETVPSLTEGTVFLADRHISLGRFQDALHVIVRELQARGVINGNLATFTYIRETSQGEGAAFFPDYEEENGRSVPTSQSDVEIYDPAFTNVPWLYSTIMHEYVHVLQQQEVVTTAERRAPDAAARAEVEAYLWEIEHAVGSGIIRSPAQMQRVGQRLTDHFNALQPATRDTYRARYEAAMTRVNEVSQGILPVDFTYSIEDARQQVQEASRHLAELVRQRETASDDEREEIDRQIAEVERNRSEALVEVVLAENPNVQIVDRARGIYRVPVVDGQGHVQYLYGGILVAWHIAEVAPETFSIGVNIRERSGQPNVASDIGVAGTGVQGRINPYPGDIDFVEQIEITAEDEVAAGTSLAEAVIDFVRRNLESEEYEFLYMWFSYRTTRRGRTIVASHTWSRNDIMAAARSRHVRRRLARQLTTALAINTFWRGWVQGRFIDFTKVINARAISSATGEELFATEGRAAAYNVAFLERPAELPASNLGQFADSMRQDAIRRANAQEWLKAAKRAYNYFTVIGNLEAMAQLQPVFRTTQTMVSQQTSVMEAIARALLPSRNRGHPTRILQVTAARDQLNRAADIVQTLPAAGNISPTPAEIAVQLRSLVSRLDGDDSGLLAPNLAQSDELNNLLKATKKHINEGIREVVERIINQYVI
jgi:hypothetical protein